MEVRNRFKGLDLIDRVPDELWIEVCDIVQDAVIKTIHKKKKCKKVKWLSECDPIDRSPPGSPVPGILQARTLVWVAISFSNA